MTNLECLKDLLIEPKNILITSHIRPDADALGSSLGLAIYLEKKGHNVKVIMPTEYPDFLKWMATEDRVLVYESERSKCEIIISESDIAFSLDYNSFSRIGEMGDVLRRSDSKKVLIDHHLYPESFADFSMSDTNSAATAILIYELINLMGDNKCIDSDIGECLYAGMVTDTGSFRFPSTNKAIHLAIADLMDKGLDHSKVHESIFDTNSESKLKFLGYCLSEKLKVLSDGRTAYISLSKQEIQKFNLKNGDTEGLVNYSLSISGIVFAVLMKEDKGFVRMSFRSKGTFSVNEFARNHFSGGGHKNASGGKMDGDLKGTISKFESLVPQYIEELESSFKSLR